MTKYADRFKCPKCKTSRIVMRRSVTAGKVVATYCQSCRVMVPVKAGSPKEG
jgi:transcription elongation factor Elf1